MMRTIWEMRPHSAAVRTLATATSLIALYFASDVEFSIAGEKPRIYLPKPRGINIIFSDYVSDGCFLRPKTVKDYLIEKLSTQDINVVEGGDVPNIRLILTFIGSKKDYGYCHIAAEMSLYYTIEYAVGDYVYDGLIFIGGTQQELNSNDALDTKILSAIDDFIPDLIRATKHLR